MKVYLAGSGLYAYVGEDLKRLRPYILSSYYYVDADHMEQYLPYIDSFLLDSGAFSFAYGRGGGAVSEETLHAYLLKYAGWVNRYHIKQFFELDVDKIVGYSRVLDYRKELQDLTGEPSIPVWHIERGADEFLKTCEEFPYVAIGGIVSKDIKRAQYQAFKYMIKEAHKRGAKIHGLGFTAVNELGEYHFDSVDSSAWTTGNRFGYIDIFHNGAMIRKKPPKGCRLKVEQAARNNFCEWVKFQRYAENKL